MTTENTTVNAGTAANPFPVDVVPSSKKTAVQRKGAARDAQAARANIDKRAAKKSAKAATPTKKGATKKATPAAAPVKKAAKAKTSDRTPTIDIGVVRGEKTEDGRRKTLRRPQIALLQALASSKTGTMTRAELHKACPGAGLTEHLGSLDGRTNKYTVSLIEHKFVKQEQHEGEPITISITATGRKALEKAMKD